MYDTAILGYHPYGQAQVDFGQVYAFNEQGVMTKHHEFVVAFPASNAGYVRICKTQNAECLLEAMQNFFVPVPTINDLNKFNEDLLHQCDEDLKRMHYEKKELISELFLEDVESMNSLPVERFKVVRLEKAKTDNYSFVRFENNRYSTSPEYNRCKLWLEIGANTIRVLDEKYREIVLHQGCYSVKTEPIIDWTKYLVAISRKPNSFRYTAFFKELPKVWQEYFKKADFDDFLVFYRNENEHIKTSKITTKNTPIQIPYKQDLSVYKGLIKGEK